jgi:hypothetical protein
MSIKLMSMIWETGPARQADRFVLLALADYANDAGECFPAVGTIARKTCMSVRGVQQILRRLEADGWLKTEPQKARNGCNSYTITPAPYAPPQDMHPRTTCTTPPHVDDIPPAPRAPEPSLTINEPSVRKKARMPAGAVISQKQIEIAQQQGHDAEEAAAQFERFKAWATANGRQYADWNAAWRNWFLSPYFKPITGGKNDNRTRIAGQGRPNRPDAALEQIARLAGLS